jgi:hypothetical protein
MADSDGEMRKPNEIDFWRGFALVTIFVNHVPGLWFERFTFRNVSLSDSAELFVLLAGWSLRLLVDSQSANLTNWRLALRLGGRAVTIYAAQILITMLALALIAAASILFDAPVVLDWHNAGPVFVNPVETHVGLVLLTHQLGYFNILPLYVVLMSGAPLIGLVYRAAPRALLPLSLAVYFAAVVSGVNFHTWPTEGRWFLNPLAWQLIFVLGFELGGRDGVAGWAGRHRVALRFAAAPVVLAGAAAALTHWSPDPIDVPDPKLLFMFDKTFLSPARVLHCLALVATFAGLYHGLARILPRIAGYLAMLGRNSLNVFCVGSVLSLMGQLARFLFGGSLGVDSLVLLFGLSIMGFTAWVSEWRARSHAPSSSAAD